LDVGEILRDVVAREILGLLRLPPPRVRLPGAEEEVVEVREERAADRGDGDGAGGRRLDRTPALGAAVPEARAHVVAPDGALVPLAALAHLPAGNGSISLPLRAVSADRGDCGSALRVASSRAFRYPRAPMELRGRWGLVTGAAKRIGRSIALALAGRGLNVIVHYHASADAAAATVREIEALG